MRIDGELPDEGKIVIGANESTTRAYADMQGLDYVVTSFAPPDAVYVMDLDQLKPSFDWSWS